MRAFAGFVISLVFFRTNVAAVQGPVATLRVEVRAQGKPIEGAEVVLRGATHRTDVSGRVVVTTASGPIDLTVVKDGFLPATASVQLAASVRIQGMRGRYTRFFSDGLPLFGEVGGLGLLQIPPMDLGQVEVIKGVASSLYVEPVLRGDVVRCREQVFVGHGEVPRITRSMTPSAPVGFAGRRRLAPPGSSARPMCGAVGPTEHV